MDFDPQEFGNIAQYLRDNRDNIENTSKECVNRVIVGRLYYSVFLILRKTIDEELSDKYSGLTQTEKFIDSLYGGSVHNSLLDFLEDIKTLDIDQNLQTGVRILYNSVDLLKEYRVAADYTLSSPPEIKRNGGKEKVFFDKDNSISLPERKFKNIIDNMGKLVEILRNNHDQISDILINWN
ncbi:hypothetical protein [Methanococcus maripaludis]|uniref:Uncharacterized protein n=1 Tax=Methanococcus maripaludis TaxID=39152 RepID=A0A8T3W7W2_METMI|nr:hypothetical protein [Methanococcus maripaludis]MBG0769340.1 hypothetical protein [Methanococcus maripaludis]